MRIHQLQQQDKIWLRKLTYNGEVIFGLLYELKHPKVLPIQDLDALVLSICCFIAYGWACSLIIRDLPIQTGRSIIYTCVYQNEMFLTKNVLMQHNGFTFLAHNFLKKQKSLDAFLLKQHTFRMFLLPRFNVQHNISIQQN